jgi:hypothetical protein
MTMPVKNIIAAIVFALIGIGYGVLASELPTRDAINVPGPAFFPNLIAGFIVFLSVALLYKGISGLREGNGRGNGLVFPGKGVVLVVWIALFIFLLPYLGFLFAGVPFFAGLMLLCEPGSKVRLVVASVAIPAFLFYLFRDGFQILLPHASWM